MDIFCSNSDKEIEIILNRLVDADRVLPSSPLSRRGGNYFTFSPFQDTQDNFIRNRQAKNELFLKKQLCIRYINKLDLTNPLCLNIQVNYTFQNYQIMNQMKNIEEILKTVTRAMGVSFSDIYIEVPSGLASYFSGYSGSISFIKNAREANLPISGSHIYLRVFIKYNRQNVVFGNFVLVNIGGGKSQLDSIFYQERMGMIKERVKFIFMRNKYSCFVGKLSKVVTKNSSIHRIMNDFITINTLFRIGVVPKSKGVGSELKRKIKNLVVYVKYYCNMSVDQLLDLYEEFVDHFHLESKHFKEIAAALKNLEIQQQSAIKKFLSSDKPNSFAHDTYGIPNEYFGFREKITKTDYSFDN